MIAMRNFTLFHADCVECQFNKYYPHKVAVSDTAYLKETVSHDYVGAEYKDNERGNANFICSDCIILDVDNTHSEDSKDWVKPETLAQVFSSVAFAVHYSRNHMKVKDGKASRPKFHVLFPISRTNSAQEYSELKSVYCNYARSLTATPPMPGVCSSALRTRWWKFLMGLSPLKIPSTATLRSQSVIRSHAKEVLLMLLPHQ